MKPLISPACNDDSVVSWKTHQDCTGTYSASFPGWGPCACSCHTGGHVAARRTPPPKPTRRATEPAPRANREGVPNRG